MIAAFAQIIVGTLAFLFCAWGFSQGVRMQAANRRQGLNGSSGMTARTVQRREVIHAMKCTIVIVSGAYALYWANYEGREPYQVIAFRSYAFTSIAFLIGLNTLWDAMDRWNIMEQKEKENSQRTVQKRQSDPTPGKILPPGELERVFPHTPSLE